MDQVHRSPHAGAFVGRAGEVAELAGRLDQALGGRGSLVLIAGEPGVGKTHLAEELADLARGRGVPVLWGSAVDSEGAPPFWPLRQVIRAWRTTVDQATFAAAVGEGAGDIALLDQAAAPSARIRSIIGPADAGEDRFQLFESVTQFLRAAAERDGVVVVLEDLHWADRGTLLFLQHFARAIGTTRVLLLVTYRDTQHRLDEVITGLIRERSTARMVLGGLSREEVSGQLTALGRDVPPEVAFGIWSRTQGNPFFVGELARLGLDDKMARGTEEPTWEHDIPYTVRSVVRRRVEQLSSPCQEMLRTASIIGSDFTALKLEALTGAGIGTVRPLIDEAVSARLLLRSRGDRFDFAHALTREVVSQELSGTERVRLHGLLAAYIEQAHAVDLEDHLAELAHHLSEAAGGGQSAKAADCARRAADQAMEQLGYEEAVHLYGLALAAAPAGWSGCPREKLLLAQATAQYRSGDLAAAATTSQKVAVAARRSRDRETQAEAALVLEGVGEPQWSSAIAALAEDALKALKPEDSELRSRLFAQLAVACFYSGSMERVDPLSREAVAMAERLGNDKALVAALRARQMARCSPDGVDERLGMGRRMLEIAARTRQPSTALWGHLWSLDALIQLGDIHGAEQELAALSLVVDGLRQPLARWHLEKLRATIAQVQGRFYDARRHAENALAIARWSGNTMAESAYNGLMRIVAVLTGGDASAHEDDLTRAPSGLFRELQENQMAWAAALSGRREAAEERYRRLSPMTHWRMPDAVALVALAFRAEVAVALDERRDAAILYERLLPHADQFVVGGAGALACSGSARLYVGRLAECLGRPELAISHLRAAIEQNRTAGAHPYTALAQAALASVLAQRGREGDAGRALLLLDESGRAAVRLGMQPLAARAAEIRAGVSGLTRRARVITPREREVARLVALGLTNREIGTALHVTERTAGNHVQHILGKLGFTARSQVAAWSVRTEGVGGDMSTESE